MLADLQFVGELLACQEWPTQCVQAIGVMYCVLATGITLKNLTDFWCVSCLAVGHDRRGNIMCVVWENDQNSGGSSCCLGLFDLDRWYHSQMPGAIK